MPNGQKSGVGGVLVIAEIAFLLVLFIVWPHTHIYLDGWNDFLMIYSGGTLAFTDRLYDPAAVRAVQVEATGATGEALRFTRLPYYAYLVAPLSHLPYKWAYGAWQVLNAAAAVGSIFLWPYSRILYARVIAAWLPLYWAFANGQDVSFLLLGISATCRFLVQGRQTAAGMVFALLGLIKFHFVWLTPLMMIRRPRMAAAFVGTAAVLFAIPTFANPNWPWSYYEAVIASRQVISKTPVSLFRWIGWAGMVAAFFAAIAIARRREAVSALTALIALAVVVSPHGYIADLTLFVPAVAAFWPTKAQPEVQQS